MNRSRLISTLNKWLVVGGYSVFAAGFWAFLVAGTCRIVFKLEDNAAMGYIGVPLFVVLTIWFCRLLPKHLRKAGVLRND